MPPKRGRGKAGGEAAAAREESQSQDDDGQPSKSMTRDVPTSETPRGTLLFTGDLESGDLVIASPNSSPVSAPAETPAPTPVRAPVQRLDSLANRAGPSASRGSPSMSKFKPRGIRRNKYERERAEREEQARLNARATDERDELRPEGDGGRTGRGAFGTFGARGDRGRSRGGRGRGDAMGRGGQDASISRTASGPFGVAPEASVKKKSDALATTDARRERALESNSDPDVVVRKKSKSTPTAPVAAISNGADLATTIKLEPEVFQDPSETLIVSEGTAAATSFIKSEPHDPIYPEEQEEGAIWAQRVSIEHINLVSEDEDVEAADLTKPRRRSRPPNKTGLRPVRLHREEHKQRVTIVNTEPATIASLGIDSEYGDGIFVEQDDVAEGQRRHRIEFLRDGKRWPGVWRDEDDEEPRIKADPGGLSTGDVEVADKSVASHTTSQFVGAKDVHRMTRVLDSKTQAESSGAANDTDMTGIKASLEHVGVDYEGPDHRPLIDKETRKRISLSSSNIEDYEAVFQTEEDRSEFARYRRDRTLMVKELGGVQSDPGSGSGDVDEMDVDEESQLAEGIERIYLFQFPPQLPPLRNPAKKAIVDPDVEMTEVEGRASAAEPPIDLTADDGVIIKTEPGQPSAIQVPTELVGDDGYIGKLVVRKSGLVELNWGGTVLKLGRGAESDRLSILMSVDKEDKVESTNFDHDSVEVDGTATGLVAGKYVATPAWDYLFAGNMLAENNEEFEDE